MDLYIEMGPPMSKKQVKEFQFRTVLPIFGQVARGEGCRGVTKNILHHKNIVLFFIH